MKRSICIMTSLVAAALTLSLAACGGGPANGPTENFKHLDGPTGKVQPLGYEERKNQSFIDIRESAERFAADFATAAYDSYTEGGNFTVSPISVYMALSIAAESAAGETRAELLDALGVSYSTLRENFSSLYRSLERESTNYLGDITGMVDLSNSIWLNKGLPAKEAGLSSLAEGYFCDSFSVDFYADNANANQAIQNFIKKQTRGLIDQNFQIQKSTAFALINTLYLKDVWNELGDELSFAKDMHSFTAADGSVQPTKLLNGPYAMGRAVETESYTHFFARTYNGYKLKFIVPKDGHSVDDVFNAASIDEMQAIDEYNEYDDENMIRYQTRCVFPEFTASYDDDIKNILRSNFGISSLFTLGCDFSTLTDSPAYCDRVQHVAKLKVDKTGIEGAAVTALIAAEAAPPVYKDVYLDFVIDRAFAFVLTDHYGTTLFSGVINMI